MLIIPTADVYDHDRTDEFHAYAEQRANNQVTVSPRLLPTHERRLYVRQTLREDHKFRIADRPQGAQAKFDELAKSLPSFFRGTTLLYYRDYAGEDLDLPLVFTVGDIHPENFGVMSNTDGAPFFGVNDFDEAYFAPFSYDVKRGATGFYIYAWENGFKKTDRKAAARAFVQGYIHGLYEFARSDREKWHQYRIDSSPKMIRKLMEQNVGSRAKFLSKWVDLERRRFIPSKKIVPHSQAVDEFNRLVKQYVRDNEIEVPYRSRDYFEVIDVAIKKGSGTASLGLDRYFVLINGPSDDPADNRILEFKQTRRPALHGLVPVEVDSSWEKDGKGNKKVGSPPNGAKAANRIVNAHDIHLAGGDPFYGRVEKDGIEFLVRERSPYKDEVDVDELDEKEMLDYATICGHVLAQTHARSDDDTGILEGNAEKTILGAIQQKLFVDDTVRFARAAAKRLHKDYKLFRKDHTLDAFTFVRGPDV